MKFVPMQEHLDSLLQNMLEKDEVLETSFYGAIVKIGKEQVSHFCYFGITEGTLLIAIINILDVSKGRWFSRVPINIRSCKVRYSIVPHQRIIHIKFAEGKDMKIRAYGKVYTGDIGNQELNIDRFIEILTGLVPADSNS